MSLRDTVAKNGSLDNDYGDAKGGKAPATFYIAIFDALGNEVTNTGGVNRIGVANTGAAGGTNFPDASGGQKTNGATFTSSASTGAWAADGHTMRMMSAASAGTAWDDIPLDADLHIPGAGYAVRYVGGAITIVAA